MEVGELQNWIERADRAESAGDVSAAADALERCVAVEPRDAQSWKRLARAYQELGRDQDALSALIRAASIYTEAGAGIQAIAVCRWILEVDPTHTSTLDRLAELRDGAPPANEPNFPNVARVAAEDARPRSAAPLEEVLLTETIDPEPAIQVKRYAEGLREIDLGTVDVTEVLEPEPPPRADADAEASALGETARFTPTPDDTAAANPETARTAARGLVATPLFGRLAAGALRKLIAASNLRSLAEGEVLFRQGDAPDALYVVVEGAVVPIAEGETRQRLSVLEPGAFFGEIALVTDLPRNATIEALVDTQLLSIDRSTIGELIEEEPEMLAVLLRFLRERLVSRLLQTSPVFAGLGRGQRAELARQFRLMEVQPGTILIEQGQQADALYVVLAGELSAIATESDGDKELGVLGAGAPCGEMSLLHDAPAMASIVARRKSWVLLLPRADFEKSLALHPALQQGLRQIASNRRGNNLIGFDSSDLEML